MPDLNLGRNKMNNVLIIGINFHPEIISTAVYSSDYGALIGWAKCICSHCIPITLNGRYTQGGRGGDIQAEYMLKTRLSTARYMFHRSHLYKKGFAPSYFAATSSCQF